MTLISTAPMTLADYSIISHEPLVKKVIMSLVDNGSVMARDIPFFNKQALTAQGVRWADGLPTPHWASLNEQPQSVTATPKPYQEQVFILRDNIDTDKLLVQDENQIVDPRGSRIDIYMKAVSFDFNYKFINNNHITGDSKAPIGLRYRLDNTLGCRSEQLIDAGGVDLTLASMTADTANHFVELVDQLVSYVEGPAGYVCLYMNETMKRRFATALRKMGTSGGLDVTKDQFDRSIEVYKDCRLYDIGRKLDQTSFIIQATETAAGADGSDHYTSIYAVNYGPEHMYGWQFDALQAHDLGLLNDGVNLRTNVDWAGGLMNDNLRSFARLFDIKIS